MNELKITDHDYAKMWNELRLEADTFVNSDCKAEAKRGLWLRRMMANKQHLLLKRKAQKAYERSKKL